MTEQTRTRKSNGKPVAPIADPAILEGIQQRLRTLSEAVSRASVAAYLGKSYGDRRKLYEALGYKLIPVYGDFYSRYRRGDIARAIIDKPVKACWRKRADLVESEDAETPFEKAWAELVKVRQPFSYFSRVDRLASIGAYAVLLLGLDDGDNFELEATTASNLLYLQTFSEGNAAIAEYQEDKSNPRCGLPEVYNLTYQIGTSVTTSRVHHSRVIHVAEDLLESDVEGQSRIEPVMNRLEDMERVVGGSAEMFWRGAFPGYNFAAEQDAAGGTQDLAQLQDEIEDYMHGLKRYLKTQGVRVDSLPQQVADPRPVVESLLDLIAAATGIPKRILMGSERGELASSQDSESWNALIDERRQEHCEPRILRPFVKRICDLGIIPQPTNDYVVRWPSLAVQGEKEEAEIGKLKTESIATYAGSSGAEGIVPPEIFLRECLGFSPDEISEIEEILTSQEAQVAADDRLAEQAKADALAEMQSSAATEVPIPGVPAEMPSGMNQGTQVQANEGVQT